MNRKKIILLMQWKDRQINKALKKCGKPSVNYFDAFDENAIYKWSDIDCSYVWFCICENIHIWQFFADGGHCPFCVKHNVNCRVCSYSIKHHACNSTLSTYNKIRHYFDAISITGIIGEQKIIRKIKRLDSAEFKV